PPASAAAADGDWGALPPQPAGFEASSLPGAWRPKA
ncbi:magnesium chelatase, partial [Rubrivivax gelatinosus]|nr:magnesium chelatase [Rubrivivax gelatinosus]